MAAISTTSPTLIEPTPGQQITILNNGGQPVLYSRSSGISATVFDGTLNNGSQMTITSPLFFLAAGALAGSVDTYPTKIGGDGVPSVAQKSLIKLAIIAEVLAEGLGVERSSLDYPSTSVD